MGKGRKIYINQLPLPKVKIKNTINVYVNNLQRFAQIGPISKGQVVNPRQQTPQGQPVT